tara:strand:- start:1827 stop:2264 length:438 start_codon:yes stop_codon:yes gene_type:complete
MKDVFSVRRSADSDEVLKSINGLLVKVITPAYDSNDITLSDKDSGAMVILPATTATSTITLPTAAAGLNYRLVMGAASNSAHTLTIAGSFIGLGVDAGVVMPLTGTDIVIAASDFKKGDYLNFVCDGTNWFVEAQFVTADAATVS